MDRVSTLLLVQSTASTAAGSRDKHVGTKLLLTLAMSADILIHITCCCTYYFCKALALAEFTFKWRCTLFVALRSATA
jgi:hypothetical protein